MPAFSGTFLAAHGMLATGWICDVHIRLTLTFNYLYLSLPVQYIIILILRKMFDSFR